MNRATSFKSQFADMMERFCMHKQMQGYDYRGPTKRLSFFDRFLCSVDCSDGLLHSVYFFDYLKSLSHLTVGTRRNRLGAAHQFSLYLNAFRPESRIMPLRLLPAVTYSIRFRRITAAEVRMLMDAAKILLPQKGVRPACIRFLIGLLYATGLRISEAINLNLADVDLEHNTLFVRRGKFAKDRFVALSPSAATALRTWLNVRSSYAGSESASPLLIVAEDKRLGYQQAKYAFNKLCMECGLIGDPLPRLHDLRHNYASECLARWQRAGKDIQSLLPVLTTSMGHVNPHDTQRYLHINATTLLDASEKIHKHFTGENQ